MSTILTIILYIWAMKNYSVYGLIDPRTNQVFYIGETKNIDNRYKDHCKNKKYKGRGNKHKIDVISELNDIGIKPSMIIFDTNIETKEKAVEIETLYIAKYREMGVNLSNINNGGNNPPYQKGKKFNSGAKILASTPLKKTVYQYDKNLLYISSYISVREASRQTGIDHRSIAAVANGSNPNRKTAGGYYWKYKLI